MILLISVFSFKLEISGEITYPLESMFFLRIK